MGIGSIIRKRRLALGIKQTVFAEMAGLNAAADVSRIETGKWWPSETKFQSIAVALGCKVADLFTEAEGVDRTYAPTKAAIERAAKESSLPTYLNNEDILRYVLGLNVTIAKMHASHSRSMQIIFHAIAKQIDGAKLLTDLKNARDKAASEQTPNELLDEMLNHLISQIMRSAGDKS